MNCICNWKETVVAVIDIQLLWQLCYAGTLAERHTGQDGEENVSETCVDSVCWSADEKVGRASNLKTLQSTSLPDRIFAARVAEQL
jgi:hypothetical protein